MAITRQVAVFDEADAAALGTALESALAEDINVEQYLGPFGDGSLILIYWGEAPPEE
jgi:hypothetical protein